MFGRTQRLAIAALGCAAAIGLAACGGSGGTGKTSSAVGPATVVAASAPDSLDPQVGVTTSSTEATWNVYLGLYTYAHANGTAGTKVIPALAAGLPRITDGGTFYSTTLRKGLVFSDGTPVKASDFTYAIERAIKLNWENKSFLTEHIAGAEAYDQGKASSISGISTDDATGAIQIKLTAPYGPFLNVLAFPAAGLIPSTTPIKALPNDPPPGVGPYVIAHVLPGRSFEEQINPRWAAQAIPGIPTPSVAIQVKVQSNPGSQADEVLSNSADLFDWNTPLPPTSVRQAKQEASDRYSVEPVAQVSFFFLNTSVAPFNSLSARMAVETALNRAAYVRLASGYLRPGCYLVPPQIIGYSHSSCPGGEPTGEGDIAKAKQMVRESGTAGQPVTVWGPSDSPHREFVDNFAQMLDAIGYKANERVISPSTYYPTVAKVATKAQAGFAEYTQDFPNPVDFDQLVDGSSIQPEANHDFSLARDSYIDSEIEALGKVPASQLPSVVARAEALTDHISHNAYVAVIGYQEAPKLTSDRVDFGALVFSPVYGPDWTTLKLK
ncbi:MAG TPA: ABC transporter substrate-binding protein [Solirubrobacteraceae bacterium]|nr:ABC transporter substrate-binding protein [Solirubrobacteraceae bacterium]